MWPGLTLKEIRDVIADAFDEDSLSEALRFYLDVKLANITAGGAFGHRAFKLLEWAEMNGREIELLQALGKYNPGNTKVQQILLKKSGMVVPVGLQTGGVATKRTDAADGGLEGTVKPYLKAMPKFNLWREKMTRVEGQVCHITYPVPGKGPMRGTGFLVGPDAVLTNYHVMQFVIAGQVSPQQVECRFDYKQLVDGTTPYTPVKLAAEWDIDHSPYSAAEAKLTPDAVPPTADELDYTLVRLAEPLGNKPWAKSPGNDAPNRGWVCVPEDAAVFPDAEPMPIIIAQHPDGRSMELAIDTAGVDRAKGLWLNAARNRVRYATNTEGGSSGSPCFDFDWRLVALHHYGDPAYGHPPAYNQGVPITEVRKRLAKKPAALAALGGDVN